MEGAWAIPLADVRVDEELEQAGHDAIASGWWSMGPRVDEFESAFAALTGSRHAFAVANGTAALHLALLATGVGPGDEVILPSLNFVAAANTIALVGAQPVFCEINGPHDLNLDPADVEAAISPRTKAILVLHYGGFPCDLGAVRDIAARHGLLVIEDAAHAPGGTWQGKPLGSFGAAGCFSFFSNKNLAIGEGGMVVTDDDDVAERLRLLRSHGMTTLTWDRHRGHAASYDVVLTGLNYRLDELRAALGSVQLRRLLAGNAERARHAAQYRVRLGEIEGVDVPFAGVDGSSHHLQVALLPPGVSRDSVRQALAERRIQTSFHYPPIHTFSRYAPESTRALPRTEAAADRLVTLPLFPHMSEEQVDAVVDAVADAVLAPVAAS